VPSSKGTATSGWMTSGLDVSTLPVWLSKFGVASVLPSNEFEGVAPSRSGYNRRTPRGWPVLCSHSKMLQWRAVVTRQCRHQSSAQGHANVVLPDPHSCMSIITSIRKRSPFALSSFCHPLGPADHCQDKGRQTSTAKALITMHLNLRLAILDSAIGGY
jgi:hypothetical protein